MIFNRPDELYVFKGLIDSSEQEILYRWACQQEQNGTLKTSQTKSGVFYATHESLTHIPELFWNVRERVVEVLELEEGKYMEETQYKCMLTCVYPGGAVHSHRDHTGQGHWHLRANVVISNSEQGGLPIVEYQTVEVEERDMWVFSPSHCVHWSQLVKGDRKRFACSYGFLVKTKTLYPQAARVYQGKTQAES